MKQPELEFPTQSPFNGDSVETQNRNLYKYLETGKHINCTMEKVLKQLKIKYLNSRISDLHNNKLNPVRIERKRIKVGNTSCMDYWISSVNA